MSGALHIFSFLFFVSYILSPSPPSLHRRFRFGTERTVAAPLCAARVAFLPSGSGTNLACPGLFLIISLALALTKTSCKILSFVVASSSVVAFVSLSPFLVGFPTPANVQTRRDKMRRTTPSLALLFCSLRLSVKYVRMPLVSSPSFYNQTRPNHTIRPT